MIPRRCYSASGLAGLDTDRAQDAFRALESIGRVKRRYNLWGSVSARRIPQGLHRGPDRAERPDPDSPAGRLLAALGSRPGGRPGGRPTEKLTDLAARAGLAPPTAQVLLTRLAALGLAEAEGKGGVLSDVLVKTAPLTRREVSLLAQKLVAGQRAALAHLDAIGRYASPDSCRRQRILDYFEEDSAPRVAPCGGCDVCMRGEGGLPGSGRSARRGGAPKASAGSLWGRLKDLLFGPGHTPGHTPGQSPDRKPTHRPSPREA